MPIYRRPYTGPVDQQRIAELVQAFPDDNLHVVDLPWRLSSWAFDYPENIGLWEDEAGRLLAWVVLQTPFWTVDYALHPSARAQGIVPELLHWASTQATRLQRQPNGHSTWFIQVRADQTAQLHEIEQAGYVSLEHAPENPWSGLFLVRSGQLPVPEVTLPDGFMIRPLAGEAEVQGYTELHQAAFGSPSMTAAWRARTLQQAAYRAELDLVIEASNGQLVAFCVCWVGRHRRNGYLLGQIEPTGVHPDYRQMGLGRAVLLEGLRRLQAQGVATMIVETDDSWEAAVAMYGAVGFEMAHRIIIHRKDVSTTY